MNQTALRSTTAIMLALSLAYPLPLTAQSGNGLRMDDAGRRLMLRANPAGFDPRQIRILCAEQDITDAQECADFITGLEAESETAIERAEPAGAAPVPASDMDNLLKSETEAAQPRANGEAATTAAAEATARARMAEETAREDIKAARDAVAAKIGQEARDRAAELEAPISDRDQRPADAAQDAVEGQTNTATAVPDPAVGRAAQTARIEDATRAAAQTAADTLMNENAAATLAESAAEADLPANVMSEILTDETRRASSEEFEVWSAEDLSQRGNAQTSVTGVMDSSMSDLERAGLIALGAVAVGAVLLNGQRVASQTGDRVILVDDAGTYTVLKDDDALLRAPGTEVRTESFADGSTRTVVIRENGTRIVTVRDVNGRALRRVRIDADGREYLLIDDTRDFPPVVVQDLPDPVRDTIDDQSASDAGTLRLALLAADGRDLGRAFSLRQVRDIVQVRELAPEINLGGVIFETNSAAIPSAQAERLRDMGLLMQDLVRDNPTELFLVEGHTDAVGDAGYNLLLSDRRAESVALAFSEYFGVGAENMVVQGYGERFLKIPTQSAERRNRRVAVRRITRLLSPY